MAITVKHAHHITLTYSNHGKHTATWKGFDEKTVRRTIQLDQWHVTLHTLKSWTQLLLAILMLIDMP